MRLVAEIRERLRALFRRGREDRELEEELRFHLEMEVEENLRRGLSATEARRRAVLRLGGVTQVAEATREARGVRWLDDVVWDAHYALRAFAKRPMFTAAVVGTLALGIGPNTVMFGIVDALFLRPPPGVRGAGDVVRVHVMRDQGAIRTTTGLGSYVDYEALREHARGFVAVAAILFTQDLDLGQGAEAERVRGRAVTWSFFPLLGVRPALGRFFLAEEDSIAGAHPVAVLSHAFWQRRFAGDSGVVGRTLMLNGEAVTVVGVAEAGFRGIDPVSVDVWVPMALAGPLQLLGIASSDDADWRREIASPSLKLVARLGPGVARGRAEAEADAVLTRAAAGHPRLDPTPDVRVSPLTGLPVLLRSGDALLGVAVMFLPTTIVLAIACANVANLLLARGTALRRETAVRAALGAGRGRLVRQHLVESMVLGVLGGAGGLVLAAAAAGVTRRYLAAGDVVSIDVRVLAYALAASLFTGIVFGLVPALRSAGVAPASGLKGAGATLGPSRGRLRLALVTFQVALSLVLLPAAGLVVRSLREVYAIDPGLDTDRLLIVSVDLGRAGYDDASREMLYDVARDRVLRVAGVEAAALAQLTPLDGEMYSVKFDTPGADTSLIREGPDFNWVGAEYFRTAGTRVVRGRDFDERDAVGSEPVAVINEPMARILAAGGDPLGRCIAVAGQVVRGGCTRIVGIVETTRLGYLDERSVPQVYVMRRRDAPGLPAHNDPVLLVRTRGRPADVAPQVRAAVQGIAANLPYVSVRPFAEMLRLEVEPHRLGAALFTLVGALALLIAATGLYGVLGYFVAERTAEIGIRRSLGASDRGVVGLVVRQGMKPVALGFGIGLAVAPAAGRVAEALLYGVSGRDPVTLAAVAALLVLVSLLASWFPARRAARVDPMTALRVE